MKNIIEITDYNSKELDIYARLNEAQLRHYREPDGGIFIAESPKTIERAFASGCQPVSVLMEKKHITGEGKHIVELCRDCPIYVSDFDVLTNITGFKLTRGSLCAFERPTLYGVEELCSNAKQIAILEDIVNPTNIGAIFRSAAALHIDAILLTPACADPLSRRSIRVSMGTVFQIPWTYIGSNKNNIWQKSGVKIIKNMGFKTVAMALSDNSVNIDNPRLKQEAKLAIILGTEGDGLKHDTISDCDYTVKIPMSHGVDSLNVAAASAVAFWELCKNRDK